jgi:hypothetical protein
MTAGTTAATGRADCYALDSTGTDFYRTLRFRRVSANACKQWLVSEAVNVALSDVANAGTTSVALANAASGTPERRK